MCLYKKGHLLNHRVAVRAKVSLGCRSGGCWDKSPVWTLLPVQGGLFSQMGCIHQIPSSLRPHTWRLPVRSWASPLSFSSRYTVWGMNKPSHLEGRALRPADRLKPMGEGVPSKVLLCPERKGVVRPVYPVPPVVLITVITNPSRPICRFCLKIGLKTEPVCKVKTRVFPGEWWHHRTGVPEGGGDWGLPSSLEHGEQ